MSRLSADCR